MTDIVIASAARTPVGAFNGAFASLPAHALGTVAIKAAMERAKVEGAEVDEVIMGQILAAGAGQNPARQASVNAGIPVEHTAFGINQLCGSGLRAVALAAQQIATGDAKIVVAGGQESMTQAPHAQQLRAGQKMGDLALVDTMLRDGLMDAFHGYHMGNTAENVAQKFQITRDEQDEFAFHSQRKAGEAIRALREAFENVRQQELTRFQGQLGPEESARLEQFSQALVNKLLHRPTLQLKKMSSAGVPSEELLRSLEILGITESPSGD